MGKLSEFFPGKWVKRILPLAFVTGLLANFPASVVWNYIEPELQLPRQVSVEAVSGSIWRGETVFSVLNQGQRLQLKGKWGLGLSSFLDSGELLSFTLIHPGTELKLSASPSLSFTSVTGQLSGYLHPLLINPFLKQNKAWISGNTSINNLSFRLINGRPDFVRGAVIWQGGNTYFIPLGGKSSQLIQYPQLAIKLSTETDGTVKARVTTLSEDAPLIEANLNKDGWLSAQVFGRLKQAVPDLPVPRKPVDQALVKYKEKVF